MRLHYLLWVGILIMNDHLRTSAEGLEFISKWEGCILKPYKDIVGLRTIGVGHLIKPGENFPDGVEISRERALEILAADVKICEDAIKKNIKVSLNQNQFDALVSFGFNCGTGVYSTSGACISLNQGKYEEVPEKLLDWSKIKVNGVLKVNKGLFNRRKSEGELFAKNIQNSSMPLEDESKKEVVYLTWDILSLKEAQNYLKILGLYKINLDGLWGPKTEKALKDFSSQNNLSLGDNPKLKIPFDTFAALKTAAGK